MQTTEVVAKFTGTFRQNRTGDAGYDLASTVNVVLAPHSYGTLVDTQVESIAIPEGYFGMVTSRSGLSIKGIVVTNAPGVVDSNYRGPVKAIMSNLSDEPFQINAGDRIAQMVIVPHASFHVMSGEPDVTVRGSDGFGSSGV